MILDFLVEKISVLLGFQGEEGLSKACGERWSGFFDSLFSSCDFGSVSRIEMIDGLFWGEFGDGRQNGECVAG